MLPESPFVTGDQTTASEGPSDGKMSKATIRSCDVTPEKEKLTVVHQSPQDSDQQQQHHMVPMYNQHHQHHQQEHHLVPMYHQHHEHHQHHQHRQHHEQEQHHLVPMYHQHQHQHQHQQHQQQEKKKKSPVDATVGGRRPFRSVDVQSSSKPPPSKSTRTTPASPGVEDLKRTVIAALPYLAFLTSFALNEHLRVLPTAADVDRVTLHNVSRWESTVLPYSVHRIVASVQHPVLDLLAALPYLAHYVLPLVYPVYLYLSDRLDLLPAFYRLLGWSMWVHYVTWFCLPTFPPWAVVVHAAAPEAAAAVVGNATPPPPPVLEMSQREGRAFARVDQIVHWSLFHRLFSGNPVPFASFPSGHVAWPTCIFLILPPGGPAAFGAYVALVSWATMYSDHHYLFDVLAAILVVASTQRLINFVAKPAPPTPGELTV